MSALQDRDTNVQMTTSNANTDAPEKQQQQQVGAGNENQGQRTLQQRIADANKYGQLYPEIELEQSNANTSSHQQQAIRHLHLPLRRHSLPSEPEARGLQAAPDQQAVRTSSQSSVSLLFLTIPPLQKQQEPHRALPLFSNRQQRHRRKPRGLGGHYFQVSPTSNTSTDWTPLHTQARITIRKLSLSSL